MPQFLPNLRWSWKWRWKYTIVDISKVYTSQCSLKHWIIVTVQYLIHFVYWIINISIVCWAEIKSCGCTTLPHCRGHLIALYYLTISQLSNCNHLVYSCSVQPGWAVVAFCGAFVQPRSVTQSVLVMPCLPPGNFPSGAGYGSRVSRLFILTHSHFIHSWSNVLCILSPVWLFNVQYLTPVQSIHHQYACTYPPHLILYSNQSWILFLSSPTLSNMLSCNVSGVEFPHHNSCSPSENGHFSTEKCLLLFIPFSHLFTSLMKLKSINWALPILIQCFR